VFCGLSDFQLSLYKLFISSPEIQALLRGVDSQPLKAINILKKLCNHPELLDLPSDLYGSEHLIPEGFCGPRQTAGPRGRDRNQTVHCEWSGKFIVLERCAWIYYGSRTLKHATDSYIVFALKPMTRSFLSVIILKR
jgi:DNA repair and recombination RAD54-like protein